MPIYWCCFFYNENWKNFPKEHKKTKKYQNLPIYTKLKKYSKPIDNIKKIY